MDKLMCVANKYHEYLGKAIVVVTVFSSVFISGVFGWGIHGTAFNYVLCALLLLYLCTFALTKRKEVTMHNKFLCLILIYIGCNVVSIVLNMGKVDNLKIFTFTTIQWLVLFMFYRDHSKFVRGVLNIANYFLFCLSSLGLYLFIVNYWVSNFGERFCGVYENPNTGAVIAFLSVALSFYLLSKSSNWKKCFLILNIIIQICTMRLCMSRAGNIVIIIFLLGFSLVYTYLKKKKMIYAIVNCIFIVMIFLCTYNIIAPRIYYVRDYVLHKDEVVEEQELSTTKPREVYIDTRDEEKEASSDNYRMLLLQAGFQTALEKPIFGYGLHMLPNAVSANSSVPLDGIKGGGVHNTYLETLVANGFVGLLSFVSILLLLIWNVFKDRRKILKITNNDELIQFSVFLSLFICFLVYGVFESVLVLNGGIIANIFILSIGGLRYEQ